MRRGDGADVVGDLKTISLPEALRELLMSLVRTVHSERLAMAADPVQREKLHYPCLVCVERFQKTGEEPMLVQLTRTVWWPTSSSGRHLKFKFKLQLGVVGLSVTRVTDCRCIPTGRSSRAPDLQGVTPPSREHIQFDRHRIR
jgi:hypothetical protein